MTIEFDKEKAARQSPEHVRRRAESCRINHIGEIVRTSAILRLVIMGIDQDSIIEFSKRYNKTFYGEKSNRNDKIKLITEQEQLSWKLAPQFNPGARENPTAANFRRLTLIHKVVVGGLAEGQNAVDAVDLFMGNLSLDLESLSLVKNTKE